MDEEHHATTTKKSGKQHNILPSWGNEATMNLNPLILANIQGSSYFKVHLFKLKTYHEVVDEIYYQVKHLEPWERGSRKTAGQTGMCGGVRGVGAGGIVSTAFCLLYKLYTLRLTRKQVNGLLTHTDSPYIRALGFMYIRYTQPPGDLYDWYEEYLQDDEEIDVKAGGGQTITIGQMAYQFLTKLDWFSTLFPRIPVPIKKQIDKKLEDYIRENNVNFHNIHQQYGVASGGSGVGGGDGSPPPPPSSSRYNYYSRSGSTEYGVSSGGGGGSRGKYSSSTSVNDRERDQESRDLERRRREERRSFERRDKEREHERESSSSRDYQNSNKSHKDYHHHYPHQQSQSYYQKDYKDDSRRRKDDDSYNNYERSRSRDDGYEYKEKEKHKRKHKNKDKERSRSRERRDRDKDYYRNDRNNSREYYKEREYDRKYR